jgi:hypothetical protein
MINDKTSNWRVDRRIPPALLMTLILQVSAGIVWAAQLNARVGALENQAVSASGFGEKLARIDERLQGMKQYMEDIKHQIEFVSGRLK